MSIIFDAKYKSLRYLSNLDADKDLTMGFITSLACIRALAYVTFNQITSQILITFSKCKWDLVGFFVVLFGLLLGYALQLQHMLGGHMREFSNLPRSIASLFSFIWGEIDFEKMMEHDWKSLVVLASYFVVMVIFMFNLMLAIILGTYDRVRVDPMSKGRYLKLGRYFYKLTDNIFSKYLMRKITNKFLIISSEFFFF